MNAPDFTDDPVGQLAWELWLDEADSNPMLCRSWCESEQEFRAVAERSRVFWDDEAEVA